MNKTLLTTATLLLVLASASAQSRVGIFLIDRTDSDALEYFRGLAPVCRDWVTSEDFYIVENGGKGRFRLVEFDVLGTASQPLEIAYTHFPEYNSTRSLHPSFRAFATQLTSWTFQPEQDPFRPSPGAPQTNLYENLCTQLQAGLDLAGAEGRLRLVVFSDGIHFTSRPAFDMYHAETVDSSFLAQLVTAYGCALPSDLTQVEITWVGHRTLENEVAARRAVLFWRDVLQGRGATFRSQ